MIKRASRMGSITRMGTRKVKQEGDIGLFGSSRTIWFAGSIENGLIRDGLLTKIHRTWKVKVEGDIGLFGFSRTVWFVGSTVSLSDSIEATESEISPVDGWTGLTASPILFSSFQNIGRDIKVGMFGCTFSF